MRRYLLSAALLLAALVGVGAVGCSGNSSQQQAVSGGKRLIILTNGESPFWDAGRQGMEAAAKDLGLEDFGEQAAQETLERRRTFVRTREPSIKRLRLREFGLDDLA